MNHKQDYDLDESAGRQMPSTDEATTGGETNRRDLLLTAGALGIAALLGTATASAQVGRQGTVVQRRFDATLFSHENLSRFAGLTALIWEDPKLGQRYERDPRAVLAEHGVHVPRGIPTPLIPKQPSGGIKNIGEAWRRNEFAAADMLIKHVSSGELASAVNTQSSLSSLACPYSSFASFSTFIAASGATGTDKK